jgi:hypothetical protein
LEKSERIALADRTAVLLAGGEDLPTLTDAAERLNAALHAPIGPAGPSAVVDSEQQELRRALGVA